MYTCLKRDHSFSEIASVSVTISRDLNSSIECAIIKQTLFETRMPKICAPFQTETIQTPYPGLALVHSFVTRIKNFYPFPPSVIVGGLIVSTKCVKPMLLNKQTQVYFERNSGTRCATFCNFNKG